eukprot:TRINITY_DN65389_c0_g1_i1.p1 TRINITY_DN65389_c0_g1~~TRINITY_DN65389_c0_g1_i1.p1  ORF type:complete len:1570 (+),score=458.91 TRINITY_DN65389_c0_g1_i1:101-4810(+)
MPGRIGGQKADNKARLEAFLTKPGPKPAAQPTAADPSGDLLQFSQHSEGVDQQGRRVSLSLDALFATPEQPQADSAGGADTQAQEAAQRDARVRLVRLLRHHGAADRVADVEELLEQHAGREAELIAAEVARFGPEPPPGPSPYLDQLENFYASRGLPVPQESTALLDDYAGREEDLLEMLVERHPQTEVQNVSGVSLRCDSRIHEGGPPPGPATEVTEAQRERLTKFYRVWNPQKIGMVDDAIAHFSKNGGDWEQKLYQQLTQKYGPEPGPDGSLPEGVQSRRGGRLRSGSLRRCSTSSGRDGPPSGLPDRRHSSVYAEVPGDEKKGSPPPVTARWRAAGRAALAVQRLQPPERALVAPMGMSPRACDHKKETILRQRLERFYEAYCPGKLDTVDKVLEQYAGRSDELFRKLVAKYGPEPGLGDETMQVDEDARGMYTMCLNSNSPNTLARLASQGGKGGEVKAKRRKQRVKVHADTAHVRLLLSQHPRLPAWDEDYARWCGQTGSVMRENVRENCVQVVFAEGKAGWFPKEAVELLDPPPPAAGTDPETLIKRADKSMRAMSLGAVLKQNQRDIGTPGSDHLAPPGHHGHVDFAAAFRSGGVASAVASTLDDGSEAGSVASSPCSAGSFREIRKARQATALAKEQGAAPAVQSLPVPLSLDLPSPAAAPPAAAAPAAAAAAPAAAAAAPAAPPAAASSGPEREDTEAASAPQEEAPARPPPPSVINIKSSGYGMECTGCYKIQKDEEVNGQPVWHRPPNTSAAAPPGADEIECWLFSTPTGEWKVTDDREDFETGAGFFNTAEHGGKWPHECSPWLGEDDVEDPSIEVKVPKDEVWQEGDRMIGGKKVLARVANELTEEELQYASFKRRRKFQPKKPEVPKTNKCANCLKFDAVCSKCFMGHRKAQRERRMYLKDHFAEMPLRRKVGVFFSAIALGQEEDVRVMLDAGADPNWMAFFRKRPEEENALPEEGCRVTPLHVACAYHQPDVCYLLILKNCRYRRDQEMMWPLDYVQNDDAMHDISMMLEEMNDELDTALDVQEAWDIYHEGDYESARDAFFELLEQHPKRDACHLGLLYSLLALEDLPACIEGCRTVLDRKDIEWLECSEQHVAKVFERADKQLHDICHAEETEGWLKRCGCVLLPEDYCIPLASLRRLKFICVQRIFHHLDVPALFAAWVALYTMPLLRAELSQTVRTVSPHDTKGATHVCCKARPAWRDALYEAVVAHYFTSWRSADGELAHVKVVLTECRKVRCWMAFEVRVGVELLFSPPSTVSKLKTMFGFSDSKARSKTSSPPPGKGSPGPQSRQSSQQSPAGSNTPSFAAPAGMTTSSLMPVEQDPGDVGATGLSVMTPGCGGLEQLADSPRSPRGRRRPGGYPGAPSSPRAGGPTSPKAAARPAGYPRAGVGSPRHSPPPPGSTTQPSASPVVGGSPRSDSGSPQLQQEASRAGDEDEGESRTGEEELEEGEELPEEEYEEYEEEDEGEDWVDAFEHPPAPVPPGPSRNEGFRRFERAGMKLQKRREQLDLLCTLPYDPHQGPWPIVLSTWPQWNIERLRVPKPIDPRKTSK